MKLITYLQQQYGIPRRAITEAINERRVLLDGEIVEGYGTILKYGQRIEAKLQQRTIRDTFTEQNPVSEIVLFHKPIGYVCSKQDSYNKTIYRLLGQQYKNYYYIGRLDKESRGLVMLTNDPKTVDQYEHPRHHVTKEYIVTVKVRDQEFAKRLIQGSKDETIPTEHMPFLTIVTKLFTKGLLVDEDGKLAKK